MVTSFRAFPPPVGVGATAAHRGRATLATLMRCGARALQALAERLAPPAVAPQTPPAVARLEYHCDAGAPEGALYVDGVLFAHLEGVERL